MKSAARRISGVLDTFLDHPFVRAGFRMDVESALAVNDRSLQRKHVVLGLIFAERIGAQEHGEDQDNSYCFVVHVFLQDRIFCVAPIAGRAAGHGRTTNFMRMPSWSSLQITVHKTSYSPGSDGAVRVNSCAPCLSSKSQPGTLAWSFCRNRVKP